MLEFTAMDALDQENALIKAKKFLEEHKVYVANLVITTEASYAPSGSDCFKPVLWKAAHWRWFLLEGTTEK